MLRVYLVPVVASLLVLSSCNKTQFSDVSSITDDSKSTSVYDNFFKVTPASFSVEQPQLENNETQISFQVVMPDGTHVTDLKSSDIAIIENGQYISSSQLLSQSTVQRQTVDIIFVVDVTGSMSPTIESAKTRLINFVNTSRKSGYHTRMCLVTFGDYTLKKCDRFFDNDPENPATESEVSELISEITKLKALTGAQDPGGADYNENPMRALIDASEAPWDDKAQRFAILVTDDGFLYSPGNSGAVGSVAPKYDDVLQALQKSQVKVFAATPSKAGYDKPFKGAKGVVDASGGEWFNFNDLIGGKITLDTILGRIMNQVQTTYQLHYVLNESGGLDPSLPLNKRKIDVVLLNGVKGQIKIISTQSNLPEGRKNYAKKFKVSNKAIHQGTLIVKINGQIQNSGYHLTADGEVEFDQPPKAKAKIEFEFSYSSLKDSIQIAPIVLQETVDRGALIIIINGSIAGEADVEFLPTIEGRTSLMLADSVLTEKDPFGIRAKGGAEIKIKVKKKK